MSEKKLDEAIAEAIARAEFISLGYFRSAEAASEAYQAKAREVDGAFYRGGRALPLPEPSR